MNMNTENTSKRQRLYLGIDFGTSGARYALIDDEGNLCSERKRAYPEVISSSNEQFNIYLYIFEIIPHLCKKNQYNISVL